MNKEKKTLSEQQIKAIEAEMNKGNRVELIGTKDGIKITRIKREIVEKAE